MKDSSEITPAETTPAAAPASSAPAESAPAESAPAESAPGEATPAASTSAAAGTRSYDDDLPEKFLEFMRTGWLDSSLSVQPRPEATHHARRREALSAAFPGEIIIVASGGEKVRANDTSFQFRPGSDLIWLTGEHDPDAVLILHPHNGGHEAVLYVRPRSPRDTDEFFRNAASGELWVGRRHTLSEKSTELGIETRDFAELPEALAKCAPARTRVLRGFDSTVDSAVLPYDTGEPGARDGELGYTLSELRLVKDSWEIAQLQDAIDATVRGFEDVARVLPDDRAVSERLLEGVFGLRARHDGNAVGYASIVGAGPHATILHWIRNTGATEPGQLLLMDMGVENANLYTADVTRVLPVNGEFTPLQRDVYEIVYRSQQAGIDAVGPGVAYLKVAEACDVVLAEGLDSLGLLPVPVDEALSKESRVFRRWTLHGFGHMLGLDVHDCSKARKENYRDGSLQENYVLTVEPGLYFQTDDELVPVELRGIGIRIEDDVLVTADGAKVLSDGLPRDPDSVQTWLATQRAAGPRLPS